MVKSFLLNASWFHQLNKLSKVWLTLRNRRLGESDNTMMLWSEYNHSVFLRYNPTTAKLHYLSSDIYTTSLSSAATHWKLHNWMPAWIEEIPAVISRYSHLTTSSTWKQINTPATDLYGGGWCEIVTSGLFVSRASIVWNNAFLSLSTQFL